MVIVAVEGQICSPPSIQESQCSATALIKGTGKDI